MNIRNVVNNKIETLGFSSQPWHYVFRAAALKCENVSVGHDVGYGGGSVSWGSHLGSAKLVENMLFFAHKFKKSIIKIHTVNMPTPHFSKRWRTCAVSRGYITARFSSAVWKRFIQELNMGFTTNFTYWLRRNRKPFAVNGSDV